MVVLTLREALSAAASFTAQAPFYNPSLGFDLLLCMKDSKESVKFLDDLPQTRRHFGLPVFGPLSINDVPALDVKIINE